MESLASVIAKIVEDGAKPSLNMSNVDFHPLESRPTASLFWAPSPYGQYLAVKRAAQDKATSEQMTCRRNVNKAGPASGGNADLVLSA